MREEGGSCFVLAIYLDSTCLLLASPSCQLDEGWKSQGLFASLTACGCSQPAKRSFSVFEAAAIPRRLAASGNLFSLPAEAPPRASADQQRGNIPDFNSFAALLQDGCMHCVCLQARIDKAADLRDSVGSRIRFAAKRNRPNSDHGLQEVSMTTTCSLRVYLGLLVSHFEPLARGLTRARRLSCHTGWVAG